MIPLCATVYPACAGIDLLTANTFQAVIGLPRMRGDRPSPGSFSSLSFEFTPHARGSTVTLACGSSLILVYPACAGIDRLLMVCCGNIECLPRMRGDRPHPLDGAAYALSFTPHARGSTRQRSRCSVWLRVYPACAGIDLGSAKDSNSIHSLPRMRGDRPDTVKVLTIITAFTPHARGSTPIPVRCCRRRPVYPACAGIDRAVSKSFGRSRSLPRMRGDRP